MAVYSPVVQATAKPLVKRFKDLNFDSLWNVYKRKEIFIRSGVGFSPTARCGVIESAIGYETNFVQLSLLAQPQIAYDKDKLGLIARLGLRMPISPYFDVVPHLEYRVFWDFENPIQWTGGRKIGYGLTLVQQIDSDLKFYACWTDLLKDKKEPYGWENLKIITIGLIKTFDVL